VFLMGVPAGYSISVTLAMVLVLGVTGSGPAALQSTLALLTAPEHACSRVTGVVMFTPGVMPVAMLLQGALASAVVAVATTLIAWVEMTMT